MTRRDGRLDTSARLARVPISDLPLTTSIGVVGLVAETADTIRIRARADGGASTPPSRRT